MGSSRPAETNGFLTIQKALAIARDSENGVDFSVSSYLERALRDTWARLQAQPDTYILSKDEFALFNYYRQRFAGSPIVQRAVQRFWNNYYAGDPNRADVVRRSKVGYAPGDIPWPLPTDTMRGTVIQIPDTKRLDAPTMELQTDLSLLWSWAKAEQGHDLCNQSPKLVCSTDGNGDVALFGKEDVYGFCQHKFGEDVDATEPREVVSARLHMRGKLGFLFIFVFILGLACCDVHFSLMRLNCTNILFTSRTLVKFAINANASLLDVFEVYPPLLAPSNASCEQILMTHSFKNSYGQPYVGIYQPPACSFNRVIFNLTVTSAGRQFDRLGLMYFNDTEIFRTSTAEPTATGIVWTYKKDVTAYLSLLKQPQKIIFDLGNLIDSTYTAAYNTTLTATFFTEENSVSPADVIIPVSARRSSEDSPSAFNVPSDNATNTLTLPRNVQKAVFSIASCGQSAEEFWWSNVLSSNTETFPQAGSLYGYSPFREVQLFIDGVLAGVAWPFPIIFTGGIVPGLWRPVVGIEAFDLQEDEIDITPWLPLLCDGKEHSFEIRVAGIKDDGNGHGELSETVGSYWVVTGKVFIWLDSEGHVTTGSGPLKVDPAPSLQLSSTVGADAKGTNETLLYQVRAQRQLSFTSIIRTSRGSKIASWQQTLTYSNGGNFTEEGHVQVTDQNTNGFDISSNEYTKKYGYPLWVYSSYTTDAVSGNFTIYASVDRSKNDQTFGQPVFPIGFQSFGQSGDSHAQLATLPCTSSQNRQNGSATYIASPATSQAFSFGSTEQDFSFASVQTCEPISSETVPLVQGSSELYHRHVLAVNGTVVEDDETLSGSTFHRNHHPTILADIKQEFAKLGIEEMLGRGP